MWLKLVVTVRTALQDITKALPFHRISLDKIVATDQIHNDLQVSSLSLESTLSETKTLFGGLE